MKVVTVRLADTQRMDLEHTFVAKRVTVANGALLLHDVVTDRSFGRDRLPTPRDVVGFPLHRVLGWTEREEHQDVEVIGDALLGRGSVAIDG